MSEAKPTNLSGTWHKFYLPEIHDIYPSMQPDVNALIEMFPEDAQNKISMSIVPNWQGNTPFDQHPEFAARVKDLPGTRVLHGWTHSLGPSFLDWVFYKHDNRSEFRKLNVEEAEERLNLGFKMFVECFGEQPEWFCAPRWQQSNATTAKLNADGYAGSFSISGIHLAGGQTIKLKALNFDEGEREWKIALARPLRQKLTADLLKSEKPFRFVLHPHDATHARTRQEFLALSKQLDAAGWQALSLEDVISRWRSLN